jgi:hypothetical protein
MRQQVNGGPTTSKPERDRMLAQVEAFHVGPRTLNPIDHIESNGSCRQPGNAALKTSDLAIRDLESVTAWLGI